MTDAEIRGRLLTHFHGLRHNNTGWVPVSDMILAPEPVALRVIGGVCQQLADIGLIQWKPLRDSNGIAAGTAKITGQGVSVVEAGHSADIDIRFPSRDASMPVSPELLRVLGVGPTPIEKILQGQSGLNDVLQQIARSTAVPKVEKLDRKLAAPESPPSHVVEKKPDIVTLKPGIAGMSIDLIELWRRCWPHIKRRLRRP